MNKNEKEISEVCFEIPKDFFQCVGPADKPGNSLFKCLNCPTGFCKKTISCHNKSRQNLKKHIQACHSNLSTKFEEACDMIRINKGKKRKHSDAASDLETIHHSTTAITAKQQKLLVGQPITKTSLENWVMEYIIDCVLPIYHVDTPGFRLLVNRLTQQRLFPQCRQTLTKQLEEQFLIRKIELKQKLSTIEYVCTTADCWTSRRRSFLGVTVHWIDQDSLERKGCCLAIRNITGRHTYDVLAKELESIHQEFEINGKICYTVTDSGSNFIKAFNHFSVEEETSNLNAEDGNIENTDDTDETMQFEQIDDLLNIPSYDEEQTIYQLPPHRKCACHLLNLIASKDASKTDGALKRISQQTLTKLTAMWNKQNRSAIVADVIKNAIGSLLITPVETRWNSTYDAIVKINEIFINPELGGKFDKVFDELGIKRLTTQQKLFLIEYVEVMTPLCKALDILQGEKYIGLGFLVPTINVIEFQLTMMIDRNPNPLTICEPLAKTILNGLKKRFLTVCDSQAKLAAAVHPKFKMNWADDLCQRNDVITQIRLLVKEQNISKANPVSPKPPTNSDFFSCLSSKNVMKAVATDSTDEVGRFFNDTSSSLTSLSNFQNVRKLYIKLNTGLPASAAVERLFSLGGRIFTPLRSKLSSSHFEMMVFLRAAKW